MPSLLEALERKYFSGCDSDNDVDIQETSNLKQEALVSIFIPKLPPLQCVPELLVLNDCDIDCAGDFDAIKEKCKRVRELDLAQNKLQDWDEVFRILKHMPRIEFLNLSKNHLSSQLASCASPTISNLRSIVLNGTYLDWVCVDVLLENLPVLEELHLSLNNYKDVLIDTAVPSDACTSNANYGDCCCGSGGADSAVYVDTTADITPNTKCSHCGRVRGCKQIEAHTALKTLHFTGNPIESWCEICRLGRVFPNLENLVLAECPIKSIQTVEHEVNTEPAALVPTTCTTTTTTKSAESHTASEPSYKYFANLLFLNLSCANINTWDDIDRLARFPRLRHLRVKNWPLWERCDCTEHERRQLLIARLPNVQILNGGGVITADEREDAERAFIRYYMEKHEEDRPQRYNELVAKHGHLDRLVNVNLKPDKRVKILLTFKENSEMRLVDIYRSVSYLKVRLEKLTGLPANKMRLYYLDRDFKEMGPEEMKYPNKLLYSYNIQTGDEIIIDEKKVF